MRLAPKLVWAAVPALVALAAALDAHAITTLVGAHVAADADELVAARRVDPGATPPTALPVRSADAILARNPFDSTAAGSSLLSLLENPESAVPEGSADPRDAPPCEGLRVVAIAASSDPEWSFAAVTTAAESKAELRRRGDSVGDRQVTFVGWDRVWMARGKALCQSSLFGAKAAPPPPKDKTAAAPTVAPGSAVPAVIARGIRRNGPTDYDIDRATLDRILESHQELMTQIRVVPDSIDGRVVGIRLQGIKTDSLLSLMGLANNDRLESINGLDISNPESALAAYARIRTGDAFTVRLTRDGKPMTVDYKIK